MIFQISGLWCSHWKWKMQYILLFFVVYVAFVQHSVLSCAVCRLTLTAPTGNVTSPCYPQLYPNNQDCKWIIQAPKGFIIQLTFVDFDVEEAQNCVYDYVSISNGETTTKYCGVTARGLTYNSTGNMMNISFVSDFSIQRKGFTATYKNVPVTLRNLKVTIPQNQSLGIVSVVSTVIVPTLNQFTVCFEAARFISSPAEWKAFTYWNSLTESLSFGKSPSGHFVYISGIQCHLNLTLTSLTVTGEFFTETLQEMCITWDSRSQIVGVKTGNNFQTSTCLESKDLHIPGNGSLILGCYDNKTSSLQGDIYNFRLWDTAFESVALSNLSCDQKGNIVNWENDFWSIPSWARKAGTDLSCGTSLSSTPSTATTTCKNLGGVCQATLSTASPSTLSTTNSFGTTTNYSSNSATLSTVTSSSLRTSQLTTTYSPSSATQTTVSTTSFTTSNLNDTTYSSSSATVTSDFSSTLNNMINTTTSNAATSSPSTMITINMNDTNNINNSQPDLQERNISATFLIRMKRNPVTSSWTHLQLQDSKIKGLRGIGIISTPIVWPVKQRPAATEKGSALKEAPDNINAADFFFIPTQSTLSLSTTFRTTEISKNITIDDKLTQNISTHRNITLFLKNTSQLFDQESSKEDGSVQQDTEGSGIGNVVSSRKVSNISLDHMQISNASGRWHLHLDSIWHNSENIIVGLNDKHMAGSSDGLYQTFLNVISHPSHSTAHVSHLLSDNSLNIDKISRSCVPHNKHTSAIMPTTVYSDCISLENADKAFAVESSGLLSKFLTIPVHGTYVLQNIKETKTPFDANANLQVELNPSEHSILSSNLASLMLRNKYIHSVTTHNKDSTSSNSPSSYDLSSCNTVKTEFVSDNLNPDIPVPLPGSLPAQRANMQLLSNYYMGKFLSPSRTMIGHTHLTTNYVSESQEGLSVEVLGPLDASLNQQLMDISDSLTPSYDLLHSQLRDSRDILYNSFSPSYNVHFNQWQYTTLPYELVTSNMKASTEDPYQQQTAQLPSVEDLQANIEERLEEYDYGSTPFSGDKDFLEEEKLYLVSRNSIIRSSKSKEVVLLNSLITSSNQIEFIGNEFQVKKSYLSGHENDNYSPLETENLDSKKKTVHASQTSLSHEEKVQIQGLPIYPVYITKTLYLPCTLEKMINSGMDNAAKQNMITNTRFIQPLSKATYLDMNDLKNNKGLFAENIMSNYALEYNIFSSNSDDIDFGLSGASETPPLVHTLNGPQTPITQTLEHFPSNGDILSHPDIKIQASISNGRTAVFQGQPESIKGLYAQYFEDPNILFGVSFKSSISLLTTEWSHWSVEPSLKPPTGHVKNTDGVSTMEMSVLHTASQLLSSAFERVGISTFSTEKTATKAIIDPFLGQSSGYLYSSKEEGNYFSGTGPLFSSYGFYNQISAEGPHCSCNIFTDSACLCGLEVNGSM